MRSRWGQHHPWASGSVARRAPSHCARGPQRGTLPGLVISLLLRERRLAQPGDSPFSSPHSLTWQVGQRAWSAGLLVAAGPSGQLPG